MEKIKMNDSSIVSNTHTHTHTRTPRTQMEIYIQMSSDYL